MATVNLGKLTSAQRQELAAQLAAYEKKDAELTRLVEAFKADLDAAGFTAADAAVLLAPVKSRGPAKKPAPGVDKTGGKPTPGTTYTHPTTGETWTKSVNGKGAPKKEFVALVSAGKSWNDLVVADSVATKRVGKVKTAKQTK